MTKAKAVVIGGSNGIGLSVTKNLIDRGYHVSILDISEPDSLLDCYKDKYEYSYFDMLAYDSGLIERLAEDRDVKLLMLTAGFGRVADFEYIHPSEIRKLLSVNTTSSIEIIRFFYDRIKSHEPFFCGIMGSIAGLVSSPMFSVYAASKAAVCRFTESVNIELEVFGTENRILNVSPGSIKGTRFNGSDKNVSDLCAPLANDIVEAMLSNRELLIPDYEETYKGVIERYKADPHAFGLNSYEYKKTSGRVLNEKRVRIGYLSGTFDLFHVGHLNLLERAKKHCDYLIVGVHPDASHKGKETFIPFEERKRIIGAIGCVDRVVESCREDSDAWEIYHYDRLFVGGDYKGTERFLRYEEFFKDKEVEIVYFPYTQGTSSTQIRNVVAKNIDEKK